MLNLTYMLNSVLFASLYYSSQGKGLRKKSVNEKTNYLFLTLLKTFYFFRTSWETNYFFKKIQAPPPPRISNGPSLRKNK